MKYGVRRAPRNLLQELSDAIRLGRKLDIADKRRVEVDGVERF